MNSVRSRLALAALVVVAPSVALAHGGQLLFLFLYIPHVVVALALLFVLWRWPAAPLAKVVTAAAVLFTSAALFATNYAIQYGAIRFPFGNGVYLLFVLAQIAIPAAVGFICGRLVRHRGAGA